MSPWSTRSTGRTKSQAGVSRLPMGTPGQAGLGACAATERSTGHSMTSAARLKRIAAGSLSPEPDSTPASAVIAKNA